MPKPTTIGKVGEKMVRAKQETELRWCILEESSSLKHQNSAKLPPRRSNLRLNNWIPLLQCKRSTIATHVQVNVLKKIWLACVSFIYPFHHLFFSKSIFVGSQTGLVDNLHNIKCCIAPRKSCLLFAEWTCSFPFMWRVGPGCECGSEDGRSQ